MDSLTMQDALAPPPDSAAWWEDWVALIRPRLATLGLIVVALAYLVAQPIPFAWTRFGILMLGSLLALCGASALNQALEWEADGRMRRTADRPVPSGRLRARTAAIYGLLLVSSGLLLLTQINGLTTWAAFSGVASYVAIYTPLKPRTTLATVVGAVPGAMPTLMGWAAARGTLEPTGWVLFWILFLWQMPHFLAVAWMYRSDYQRAGFRMLTDADPKGDATVRQVIGYGLALIPVSLLPSLIGPAGAPYFVGALIFGLGYLWYGIRLGRERTGQSARALLKASVLYLPLLLGLLALDVLIG